MAKAKAKQKAKTSNPKRHRNDHRWFAAAPVTSRQEVQTPWGPAVAEVGTYLMTAQDDPKFVVICTQEDLDNIWTTDPIPSPPPPGQAIEAAAHSDPFPADLPGSNPHGS